MTTATSPAKKVALEELAEIVDKFGTVFVIEEGDLVSVVHHEERGSGEATYDFFGFHTFRIAEGRISERWSNDAVGSAPSGAGRPLAGATVEPGEGDPATNKLRVADFYRCVFDAQNAEAVRDFVTEDYRQHVRHIPTGRQGLEGFVRAAFPDGPVPTPANASIPPTILMGEGDLVVIAAVRPQPDGGGGTYLRVLYDGFRVEDGLLAEHWGGVDPSNPPVIP